MVNFHNHVIESDIVAPAIVLVEPSHPGNIGSVARAMGNMGFLDLRLVNPKEFPSAKAKSMAAGAKSILDSARVFETLDEAIADCRHIIGTSARVRSIDWPTQTPAAAMTDIAQYDPADVAIIFGTERSGLSNAETDRCTGLVRIPVNDDYASINLSTSVMLLAYEYRLAVTSPRTTVAPAASVDPFATWPTPARAELVHGFYRHAEKVLNEIRFLKVHPPVKLMRKVLRLFNRARLSEEEVNILRGILTTIEYELDHRGPRLDLEPDTQENQSKDTLPKDAPAP